MTPCDQTASWHGHICFLPDHTGFLFFNQLEKSFYFMRLEYIWASLVAQLGLIHGLGRSPGGGKGYPFQYSGQENSMNCIVHGVTRVGRDWATFTHITHITLMAESEEKLKSLLMRVKEESEKLTWNSTFKILRSWHPVPLLHDK